jgi:hypothetical protein
VLNVLSKSDSELWTKSIRMGRFDLTEEEWAVIGPHFPKREFVYQLE